MPEMSLVFLLTFSSSAVSAASRAAASLLILVCRVLSSVLKSSNPFATVSFNLERLEAASFREVFVLTISEFSLVSSASRAAASLSILVWSCLSAFSRLVTEYFRFLASSSIDFCSLVSASSTSFLVYAFVMPYPDKVVALSALFASSKFVAATSFCSWSFVANLASASVLLYTSAVFALSANLLSVSVLLYTLSAFALASSLVSTSLLLYTSAAFAFLTSSSLVAATSACSWSTVANLPSASSLV